ncbi:MAG: STAS domain-containing protein [Kiritimatiellae bacterium]|nr:STAS domain-containing protein [Kiritimatiellia bacterium]
MSDAVLFIDESRQDVKLVHIMAQRLLDPQQAETLARHLVGLFDSGILCVLVEMGSVQRLSSIFFRSFIMAGKKAGEKKAKLAFCNLPPTVQEGFTITGLTDLFPIYKNENEALVKLGGK